MAGLSEIRKITIVGSGIMGSSITQISLLSGFETVVLNDIDESALKKSRDAIASVIHALADKESFKEFVSSYTGMNQVVNEDVAKLRTDRKAVGIIAECRIGVSP